MTTKIIDLGGCKFEPCVKSRTEQIVVTRTINIEDELDIEEREQKHKMRNLFLALLVLLVILLVSLFLIIGIFIKV